MGFIFRIEFFEAGNCAIFGGIAAPVLRGADGIKACRAFLNEYCFVLILPLILE